MSVGLPGVAREVAAAGHEIGNHTDSHPLLALKSAGFIDRELSAAQEAIEDATGIRPRYFRAPYGARWFGLRAAQQRLGLTGVMWSTIALDWKRQTPAVVSRLLQGAANGAILCLHDGRVLRAPPRHWCHAPSGSRAFAEIDRARFPFRKGDGYFMSYEELTARVRAVIAATQHLPQEKITADSTFQELGIDSLDGINILFAVESEFNINIPDDAAQNLRSVRDVIDGIAKLLEGGGNQAAVNA